MNSYDWFMIKDHYYLGARGSGPSRSLSGNVVVIHVMINDMISNWMFPMNVCEYQLAASMMDSSLNQGAAQCGHSLQVTSVFCQVTLPVVVDQSCNWVPMAFSAMGFDSAASMQTYYERQYGCSEAPIIFALNRPMRSFASLNNEKGFFRQDEFSAVFRHTSGMFESRVLIHELLHQFGAADYYYPQVTVNAAYKYFPSSIMFREGNDIDELTRYLIGWTNELSPRSVAFLKETCAVNEAELIRARMNGV